MSDAPEHRPAGPPGGPSGSAAFGEAREGPGGPAGRSGTGDPAGRSGSGGGDSAEPTRGTEDPAGRPGTGDSAEPTRGTWRTALSAAQRGYGGYREGLRGRPVLEPAWRGVVLAAGLAVIGVGVVLLVIPGPGWLLIFLGLGILAAEFPWAQRLLRRVRSGYERLKAAAQRRRAKRRARVE